jgi:hypothetical protein
VPDELVLNPHIAGQPRVRGADWLIGALADRQYGMVGRDQLLRLGLTRHQIDGRISRGLLRTVHRGVYAVGHRVISKAGHWKAATLCVPSAVLSHRSAAALQVIATSNRARTEVTVARRLNQVPAIQCHFGRLPRDETAIQDGIPVTIVSRTILDLAAVERPARVERAMNEADRLRLGAPLAVGELLERYPRRRGAATLRAILAAASRGVSREELEALFIEFLDARGFPRPRLNMHVRTRNGRLVEVDFAWPEHRLIVELDGYDTHGTRASFESDRERDRLLSVSGWRVIRVTWRQLHEQPEALAADLHALLAAY